jgi:hypothetical protein
MAKDSVWAAAMGRLFRGGAISGLTASSVPTAMACVSDVPPEEREPLHSARERGIRDRLCGRAPDAQGFWRDVARSDPFDNWPGQPLASALSSEGEFNVNSINSCFSDH